MNVNAFISTDEKGAVSRCFARTHPFKSRWTSFGSSANSSFSDCETYIRSISIDRCALLIILDSKSLRGCFVLSIGVFSLDEGRASVQ